VVADQGSAEGYPRVAAGASYVPVSTFISGCSTAPPPAIKRAAANVTEAPDRTTLKRLDIVSLVYNG
jgi:NADH:ubiquinone oxidoreductase subunit B-like Fe-S oxidoreductase